MSNKNFSLEEMLKLVNVQTKTAEEKVEDKKDEKKEDEKKVEDKVEDKKEDKAEEKKEEKKEEAKVEEKKEAAVSPIDEVMKVAEKLASAEKENLVKEAQLIGTAIADAVVARLGAFEKAASEDYTEEKIASMCENDPEFAQSFYQGYMDKVAEVIESDPEAKKAFVESYEKTASEIIKVATVLRDRGYVEVSKAIAKDMQ